MRSVLVVCLLAGGAHAEDQLVPQLQADLGLSVVFAGYERPLSPHLALQFEGGIFGTYFLPWFDAGQDVAGAGLGVRPTLFVSSTGHGLYLSPYLRGVVVSGDKNGSSGTGLGYTAGMFVGWAFALTHSLDLRLGGGVQYIHFHVDTDSGNFTTSTPFVALDAVVGWRY